MRSAGNTEVKIKFHIPERRRKMTIKQFPPFPPATSPASDLRAMNKFKKNKEIEIESGNTACVCGGAAASVCVTQLVTTANK